MPMMFESIDLEEVYDDNKLSMGLICHSIENGRIINAYSGVYTHCKYGSAELYAYLCEKDGKNIYDGCNLQISGASVWKVYMSSLCLKKDATRVVAGVNNTKTGGFTVMNIINPGVLPSFLENDEIQIQVTANAISVNYYENEDALADTVEPVEHSKYEEFVGQKFLPAMGSIIPTGLLKGHQETDEEKIAEYSPDDELVLITGIVKKIYIKKVLVDDEEWVKFFVTTINTQFGDLEIVHSRSMISDKELPFLKEGAIIQAVAVLSGDPAIYEYENGIVKDREHDLEALRYVLTKGNAVRLEKILADDAIYESVNMESDVVGKKNIMDRIDYVNETTEIQYYSYLAELKNSSNHERCIILAENEEDNFRAIVRIKVNEEGLISHISVQDDPEIKFIIDPEPIFEERIREESDELENLEVESDQ